ncbi:MAG TPA: hypothetical protein VFC34_01965 [Puia sp.]|nr:hypothetical protein [Puia sp.]
MLITTKKGKKGDKVSVTYNGMASWNAPTVLPKMANSLEFAETYNASAANSGLAAPFGDNQINRIKKEYMADPNSVPVTSPNPNDPNHWGWENANANVDWFKEYIKPWAFNQKHDLIQHLFKTRDTKMIILKRFLFLSFALLALVLLTSGKPPQTGISFCGSSSNDLFRVMNKEGIAFKQYSSPSAAIAGAAEGSGVIITADGYPGKKLVIPAADIQKAADKKIRLYIEYPSSLPDMNIPDSVFESNLERVVVTTSRFGKHLQRMALLGINDCSVLRVKVQNPLLVLAKVAGFDKAEYGIDDVKTYPLLYQKDNRMVALTKLSNFRIGRYGPNQAWKELWEYLLTWVRGAEQIHFKSWPGDVMPMYTRYQPLPAGARRLTVAKGVQWFYNGRFLIDASWKDIWLKYQGDGTNPFGPPLSQHLPSGNGSLGILEGHASHIYHDGSQQYRYWIRNDVQGEVAYAMASAGELLHKKEYGEVSANLADFIYFKSNLRDGPRRDKDSPVYGMIGWALTHPYVFYDDDNARSVLGIIGASAYMHSSKWDQEIVENILANFRLSSRQGFQGDRLEQDDILKLGWKHFWERDLVNPHPHFESWMWAAYLWLYDKTKYKPLLEKTETAIRLTMDAYPDKWKWTNGIQQERARMILPLAWLVRVDNTEEHRHWLDMVVTRLLENQDASGAIREELGAGAGMFGNSHSNSAYGKSEASLIFQNGDSVADMLYTSNFAFFALNEAARATGNKKYTAAVNKLSDFLIRIQVKSKKHQDVDGAWFRAFDYGRWDYWASNADAGWGAWATLTGWIQTWILATQVLVEQHNSYWESTRSSKVNKYMPQTVELMFGR